MKKRQQPPNLFIQHNQCIQLGHQSTPQHHFTLQSGWLIQPQKCHIMQQRGQPTQLPDGHHSTPLKDHIIPQDILQPDGWDLQLLSPILQPRQLFLQPGHSRLQLFPGI